MSLTDVMLVTKILSALAPLLLLLLWGVVVYRTGSGYIIFANVWRLVVGRRDITDRTIKRYVADQHDLHSFSFFSGLRPRTFAQTLKVIEWANQHDIDLRHAARCGDYFDIEHLQTKDDKLPSSSKTNAVTVMLGVTYIFFVIVFGAGVVSKYSYMSFKDDGRMFMLNANEAQALTEDQPLTLERCKKASAKVIVSTGFSATQTNTLCAFLASNDRNVEIDKYLRGQRLGILWLTLLLAIPFTFILRWLGRVANTRTFRDEINKKVKPNQATRAHDPNPNRPV